MRPRQALTIWAAAVLLAGLMYLLAWLAAAGIHDQLQRYPLVTVRGESQVAAQAACTGSTEEIARLARSLLEGLGLEPPVGPDWLGGDQPCGSASSPDHISVVYYRVKWARFAPHVEMATIDLRCPTGVATAMVWDRGPGYRLLRPLNLTQLNAGLPEALALAESHGGSDVREALKDDCRVRFWLIDDEWGVEYVGSGGYGVPQLTVTLDAISGIVK